MKESINVHPVTNHWTRRRVLGAAGAGALAWALPAQVFGAQRARGRRIPIAVQLYSVREDVSKDMDAVLEKVARMGFEGVEFYGNSYFKYDKKAKELRKRLDDLKLKSEGIHIRTSALKGDELKQSIETSKILGTRFLIVAGDGDFTDPEKSKALAETFNKAAEALKPAGIACGYHNHTGEFKKDGDKTYWDLFAERTSKDVVLQLDVGHATTAGLDPVELIKKHPGRTGSAHFAPKVKKDETGKKAIIGQDSIDWKGCISACRWVGGTEWYVLEQESYPDGKSPMECTEMSLVGLKKIIDEMRRA